MKNRQLQSKKELKDRISYLENVLESMQKRINELENHSLHIYLNSLIEVAKAKIYPDKSEEAMVIKERIKNGFNLIVVDKHPIAEINKPKNNLNE